MSKDPAVLFYTSDFLSGTFTMSNDHIGMYIKLLCLQHQKGRLSELDMKYVCNGYVKDVWDKFHKNGDGLYYNERMEQESIKRQAFCESRRKSIQARYVRNTCVERMEDINENVNVNKITVNKEVKKSNIFIKPSITDIQLYCKERGNTVDPVKFFNHYESNGWKVGKNSMKNWKAAVHTWESNNLTPTVLGTGQVKPPAIRQPSTIPVYKTDAKQREEVSKMISETVKKMSGKK